MDLFLTEAFIREIQRGESIKEYHEKEQVIEFHKSKSNYNVPEKLMSTVRMNSKVVKITNRKTIVIALIGNESKLSKEQAELIEKLMKGERIGKRDNRTTL